MKERVGGLSHICCFSYVMPVEVSAPLEHQHLWICLTQLFQSRAISAHANNGTDHDTYNYQQDPSAYNLN